MWLYEPNTHPLSSVTPPTYTSPLAAHCRELVSLIDRDEDGLVDKEELIAYQIRLTEHNNNQLTDRVFAKNDENNDDKVSLEEVWAHGEDGET